MKYLFCDGPLHGQIITGYCAGHRWEHVEQARAPDYVGLATELPGPPIRPRRETYAAMPGYYGSTFCSGCGSYHPVGAEGEFVWLEDGGDGPRVGT